MFRLEENKELFPTGKYILGDEPNALDIIMFQNFRWVISWCDVFYFGFISPLATKPLRNVKGCAVMSAYFIPPQISNGLGCQHEPCHNVTRFEAVELLAPVQGSLRCKYSTFGPYCGASSTVTFEHEIVNR